MESIASGSDCPAGLTGCYLSKVYLHSMNHKIGTTIIKKWLTNISKLNSEFGATLFRVNFGFGWQIWQTCDASGFGTWEASSGQLPNKCKHMCIYKLCITVCEVLKIVQFTTKYANQLEFEFESDRANLWLSYCFVSIPCRVGMPTSYFCSVQHLRS